MKRVLVFFIAIMIMALVLSGCEIPFFGRSDETKDIVKDGDLVRIEDDNDNTGTGTLGADSPTGNAADSVTGDITGSGSSYGADPGSAAGTSGTSDSSGASGAAGVSGTSGTPGNTAGSSATGDTLGSGSSAVGSSAGLTAPAGNTGSAGGTGSDSNTSYATGSAVGSATDSSPVNGSAGLSGNPTDPGSGTDAVGSVNPAGGVLDNKPAADIPSLEDASSSTEGYPSESGGMGSAAPATGVLAAQSNSISSPFSEPRRPVTVYYQDKDGCVVPMTRWIQPQLGVARAAVSLAIDNPLTREETVYYGVYPTLPEHTEILGIDIKDGIATIDFNKYLLNYGTAYSERNIIASIVYTLTEFETIQKVRIMINGYPQGILKYGTDLAEPLGREDVMINSDPDLLATGKEKLDVYFMKKANTGFTYPVPVSVTDSDGGVGVMPETLVKQLLSSDPEGGMYSEMPEGALLISSYVSSDTITLDFNKQFLNYEGVAREESILKQLAYTLRQCDRVRKINILIEGRKVELPEGTNISAGLAIPVTINDYMDR